MSSEKQAPTSGREKNEKSANSTGPSIKIAPAEGHQSQEGADPGPGDVSAAPSEAPQLVELPAPPKVSAPPPSTVSSMAGGLTSARLRAQAPPPAGAEASTLASSKMTSTSTMRPAPSSSAAPAASASPRTPDSARSPSPTPSPDEESAATPPSAKEATQSMAPTSADDKRDRKKKNKKKKTKFRYHKRISVTTKGKTNPSTIMDKVNEKDHKAGITVDKLDPQELMRRAGIEGKEGTHWRIRLRQTKRTTKNGKTVTETRVAYRDSEGKSSVKTIEGEVCKKCCKKMEQCDCDH